MASRGLGAFAAGLAGGYVTASKLKMEQEDQAQRKKMQDQEYGLRDLQINDLRKKKEDDQAITNAGQQGYASVIPRQPNVDDNGELMPKTEFSQQDQQRAVIAGMDASMQEALKRGRRDVYKQYLEDSASMRAQVTAEALAKFKTSGDINPIADVYDHMYPNGKKIDRASIKTTDDGKGGKVYSWKETDPSGKISENTQSEAKLVDQFAALSDPKAWLNHTHALNMQRQAKQEDWANNPDTRPGGFKEQEIAIKKTTAAATERRADAADKTASAAERRAAAYEGYVFNKGNAGAKLTPKQTEDLIKAGGLGLRKMIESEQPKEDAKYNVNGMMGLLPDMQAELGQAIRKGIDPEIALQQTYNTVHDRVGALNDALTKVAAEANSKWTSSGKNEAMRAGLQSLMGQYSISPADIKKYLSATKIAKGDADRIRSVIGSLSTGRVGAPAAAPATGRKDYSKLWN